MAGITAEATAEHVGADDAGIHRDDSDLAAGSRAAASERPSMAYLVAQYGAAPAAVERPQPLEKFTTTPSPCSSSPEAGVPCPGAGVEGIEELGSGAVVVSANSLHTMGRQRP